jgi:glycosyltransferase involved in cell wall biosynthesis
MLRVGWVVPGHSAHADDWAIPVLQNLAAEVARVADVRVLALRYPHTRGAYVLDGARVRALGGAQGRGARRVALWGQALRALWQMHRTQPFDVLHGFWADETGMLAAWAGRVLGVPSVVSLMGGELVAIGEYGLQRGPFSRWIVAQALAHASLVTVPSIYMRELAVRPGAAGHLPRPVHVLPLGVDTARFAPAPQHRRHNHLVHVASLIPIKDQALLLRVLTHLPADVTLSVVGDGPLHATLTQQAAALGLAERVSFLGAVPHPALPQHYQAAGLHVLTSQHESFGMVTLEAAACGIATVGTAVGVLRDDPALGRAVHDGAGYAQGADPAVALASAIGKTLGDAMAGERAHAAITARYRIPYTAAALLSLYQSLLV